MQALLGRLLCGHRHGLILEKLWSYEVPIAEGSQLNLSCSVGTVGVDMVVNRYPMPRNTASASSAPGKADYPRVPRRQVLKRAEPGAGQAYSAMVTAQPLRWSTTLRVTLPKSSDLAMPSPRRPMTMVSKPPAWASSMISSATS